MEMLNYRITTSEGMKFVVWGGMTTEEQVYRMKQYQGNDVAVMHVSPKQDFSMFSRLINAIQPKVVIPHHYDIWDTLFAKNPAMKNDAPLPPEEVTAENILNLIKGHIEADCPATEFFVPEHHRWYRFGLAVKEI